MLLATVVNVIEGRTPPSVDEPPLEFPGGAKYGAFNQYRIRFQVTGTTSIPIRIEACTNLLAPSWIPLLSGTLTNGSMPFLDTGWTDFPTRIYRIGAP